MHEVDVTILLRPECDQVAVLEPLVKPLGTVVRPLLERLDFRDFLFQRNFDGKIIMFSEPIPISMPSAAVKSNFTWKLGLS